MLNQASLAHTSYSLAGNKGTPHRNDDRGDDGKGQERLSSKAAGAGAAAGGDPLRRGAIVGSPINLRVTYAHQNTHTGTRTCTQRCTCARTHTDSRSRAKGAAGGQQQLDTLDQGPCDMSQQVCVCVFCECSVCIFVCVRGCMY